MRSSSRALPLQIARHLVEVLDQPPQLVGRRGGHARVEVAARDAARRARQAVHRIGDALGHRVADAGAAEDEEQRGQQHAAIERVDLRLDLLLPRRQRHGQNRLGWCGPSTRRGREQVLEVADPLARHRGGLVAAAAARGRRRRGCGSGSRPEANRLRSLVASSRGPAKMLTS